MLRSMGHLRAKVNSNPVIGYPPGALLVASTRAGGGFVGASCGLYVWVRNAGWPEDLFPRVELPPESTQVEYNVYEEDGNFYCEKHRLKYGATIPVGDQLHSHFVRPVAKEGTDAGGA